jgi:hypothetical protein
VVGSKETPISLVVMAPLADNVGMEKVVGEGVPGKLVSAKMQ